MRKRKKRKNNYYLYIIFVIIVIASLSIGYSLFSTSLNVSGSAHAKYLISGSNLNIDLIQTGGMYTTGTIPNNITYQNEVLNQNNLTINFTRPNKRANRYDLSLIITFSNIYPYNMISGSASSQLVSGSYVQGLSTSLSKTSLIPNETGTLTVNFSNTNKGEVNIITTMSFTIDGVTQHFYYNIVIA